MHFTVNISTGYLCAFSELLKEAQFSTQISSSSYLWGAF